MKKIEITHTTTPLPSHLSGQALRSAQAADHEAEIAVARLRAAAARLEAVLNETQISAALLAEGFLALKEYGEAKQATSTLPARHCIEVTDVRTWPSGPYYGTPDAALVYTAVHYNSTLVEAGIPMPSGGDINTAQYWQDAAARGC